MSAWKKAGIKVLAILNAALAPVIFVCVDLLFLFVFHGSGVDTTVYRGSFNFVTSIATIIAMLILNKANSTKTEPFIKLKKLGTPQVIALVLVSFGMLGMVTTYIGIADWISAYRESLKDSMEQYRESVDLFSKNPQAIIPAWDSVLYVFNLCLIVPVSEELVFRGTVYGSLRKGFGPAVSVILSAVAFGIMHGVNIHIGYAIACGLILASCYYLTDSIAAPVILHMIFNIFGSGIATFMRIDAFGVPGEITSKTMRLINTTAELFMPVAVLAIAFLVDYKRKHAQKAAGSVEAAAIGEAESAEEDAGSGTEETAEIADNNGTEAQE